LLPPAVNESVFGETVTPVGAISLTVTVAVPETVVPVAVALTVIFVPAETVAGTFNKPDAFIVTPVTGGLIVHVTACDAPSGSTSALNCKVEPRVTVVPVVVTITSVGLIVPCSTVMVASPETDVPVAVAVMVAVPALTGVTTPLAETVATEVSLEDHVTA